jgi:hypothetical protein
VRCNILTSCVPLCFFAMLVERIEMPGMPKKNRFSEERNA